jgi:hypothetical protein
MIWSLHFREIRVEKREILIRKFVANNLKLDNKEAQNGGKEVIKIG